MGNAPSISRAWIGVMIYLVGLLFSFRPSALNALGVALLTALVIDPLVIIEVGFQLSFGATLGILLFYKLFEEKLQILLPKRPYKELLQMQKLDQWGYLMCAYIRTVLALNGAVLTFTPPPPPLSFSYLSRSFSRLQPFHPPSFFTTDGRSSLKFSDSWDEYSHLFLCEFCS